MKNFDADRRWLKCVMGWMRRDRSGWRTGSIHRELWYYEGVPPHQRDGRGYTFEEAMRLARKQSTQTTNEKKD